MAPHCVYKEVWGHLYQPAPALSALSLLPCLLKLPIPQAPFRCHLFPKLFWISVPIPLQGLCRTSSGHYHVQLVRGGSHCFSNLKCMQNHLRVLLKCRFGLSRSGHGASVCICNMIPSCCPISRGSEPPEVRAGTLLILLVSGESASGKAHGRDRTGRQRRKGNANGRNTYCMPGTVLSNLHIYLVQGPLFKKEYLSRFCY